PTWLNPSIILAIGVLLSLVIPRLRVLEGAFLISAMAVIYTLVSFLSFTHGFYWIEIIAPMNTLVVGYLAITIYGYVIKEQEKEFVQGAFGHYLAPTVVDQIMTNPDMINQLGGEERVMTSFFSDVAAFSTISECLTPSELVGFINNYLSEMCDIIEEHGGTIDKFEGDAILGRLVKLHRTDGLPGIVLPQERHGVLKLDPHGFDNIANTINRRRRRDTANNALFLVHSLDVQIRVCAARHSHDGPPEF
ncbi:MAG: adenylate/guanylate cyclase domain-containing protein, partial [Pseudomonadota bacterium]|nr:adenylate/guanylate cyclase domain-containing protein [Pseudomonadota bacterium]